MPKSHTSRFDLLGSGFAVASLTCWATVPLFLRSFIHEIDGWTANGVRYPFAALIWLGPLLYFYRKGRVESIYFRRALVPTAVNLAGQTLWAWAPYFLQPAMMAFLVRISSIFAVLGAFLVFRDEAKLGGSVAFWGGLVSCLLGFAGMTFLGREPPTGATLTGIIIILSCGVFWGWYGISVRWAMRGVDARVSFPIICIYTSVGTFALMLLLGEPTRLLEMRIDRLLLVALSSVVGIAMAHVFFYKAIERMGVAISTSCQLLSPFVTAVGSLFIFSEVLTLGQWGSGSILLAGCGLLLWSQRKLQLYRKKNGTG